MVFGHAPLSLLTPSGFSFMRLQHLGEHTKQQQVKR